MLVAMDNITMGDKDMLDTKFLFQPRGAGTAYLFGMATPSILIGRINPRTRKPYSKEIRENLGGLRDLRRAHEERDRRLGAIQQEETAVLHGAAGDLGQAIEVAAWRHNVAEFVTEFLPNRKGPKAPVGQGPATIRKKVSQLTQVWRWAQQRGILPYSKETPWDEQAPSAKEVEASAKKRRPFKPAETQKLFAAAPEGTALATHRGVA